MSVLTAKDLADALALSYLATVDWAGVLAMSDLADARPIYRGAL